MRPFNTYCHVAADMAIRVISCDKNNKVIVLLDKELKDKKILVHPNRNTTTISINYQDLIKFIESEHHKIIEI